MSIETASIECTLPCMCEARHVVGMYMGGEIDNE